MQISQKGRSGLVVMVELARHDSALPLPSTKIAIRHAMSLSYLEQLLSRLKRAGLIRSVRGAKGGYLLARPSSAIRISDIVAAIDGPRAFCGDRGGLDGWRAGDRAACLSREVWDELGNCVYQFLSTISLADVCERRVLGQSVIDSIAAE